MIETAMPESSAPMAAWPSFKARFRSPAFLKSLADRLGETPQAASTLTEIYLAEAEQGLRLIAPRLAPELRVLDVGAGLGLLSNFIAEQGCRVTALDPDEGGFDFMRRGNAAVTEHAQAGDKYRFLGIGAERLSPDCHGSFDLIYSVHVLEHIANLEAAMAAMASVLAPDGHMIHLCPNYAVPYEPHLAIPLIPIFPRVTAMLFRKTVRANQALWDGLRFVSAGALRRLAKRNGLSVTFAPGVMAAFIERLSRDPQFARRHRDLVPLALRAAGAAGLLGALCRLPPSLQTPMMATFAHRSPAGPHRS